jgi:hypothetical protein
LCARDAVEGGHCASRGIESAEGVCEPWGMGYRGSV